MKRKFFILAIVVSFSLLCFGGKNVYADEMKVYLGGMPAGFIIDNKGATIIGVNDVISKEGLFSPAADSGIKPGDVIVTLDGKEINSAEDVGSVLEYYDGNGITATIERGGEILIKIIYPAKDISGKYKLGVFIRDDISGIGTITYVTQDDTFGALGHPVVDANQKIVKINSGTVFNCNIIGINKGIRGKAGEIRGYFIDDAPIGEIHKNVSEGIFGKITDSKFKENLKQLTVAEAKPGKATIFSTIEGTSPKEYEISIVKVDKNAADNKDLVIKVTDEKLISKTGGILQGMSGSPIVQNGKLVGAVTHVFINDPARGFGITIEKMLKE